MRYFLELTYMGSAYHGWQRQPNAISVQEKVEDALTTLLREPVEIVGAGRTDTGVHARQLYAHFDLERDPGPGLVFRMNSLLPKDISVRSLHKMKPEAHARFDALSRTYEYHVVLEKDPFALESAYFVKRKPDVEKMNEAAKMLMEYSDFKSFSRSRTDVKTYNCRIEHAYWEMRGERLIFNIRADRFLRNMVRAVVGTLLEIGLGKIDVEELPQIIKSKNRSEAGVSVPAHGLYLTKVEYPKEIFSE